MKNTETRNQEIARIIALMEANIQATRSEDYNDGDGADAELLDAAAAIGWDWEAVDGGKFAVWCLKATAEEIAVATLNKFQAWVADGCPEQVAASVYCDGEEWTGAVPEEVKREIEAGAAFGELTIGGSVWSWD